MVLLRELEDSFENLHSRLERIEEFESEIAHINASPPLVREQQAQRLRTLRDALEARRGELAPMWNGLISTAFRVLGKPAHREHL